MSDTTDLNRDVRTVKQLIQELDKLPLDAEVVVHGGYYGVNECPEPKVARMQLWDESGGGNHKLVAPEDPDDDEAQYKEVVYIGL